jgi:hypothetical protein
MNSYRHTQPGILMRNILGGLTAVFAFLAFWLGASEPQAGVAFGLPALILLASLLLFHSLTVEIEQGWLRIRMGIGLIHRNFRIADIEYVEQVRNRWFYGWGIRLTPHGWLFTVSGLDAVQIRLRNGRNYRIGTDEPERLRSAIEAAKARR